MSDSQHTSTSYVSEKYLNSEEFGGVMLKLPTLTAFDNVKYFLCYADITYDGLF